MNRHEIIRYPEVQKITGLSRTTLWRLQRRGKFPRAFPVTDAIKGWLREDIERWIEGRAAGRSQAVSGGA